jgi:hypothetical protein
MTRTSSRTRSTIDRHVAFPSSMATLKIRRRNASSPVGRSRGKAICETTRGVALDIARHDLPQRPSPEG